MESKETLLKTKDNTVMLEDVEYYKYIFKKTEKMTCAVFYVLRESALIGQSDIVVGALETSAQTLLKVSLESLRSTEKDMAARAMNLKFVLVDFESKLRVANAARLIGTELLEVFIHEIDSVQRSLRKYAESTIVNPLLERGVAYESIKDRKPVRVRPELAIGEHTVPVAQGMGHSIQSRRERVLNVLRDKGEATIKDIVEVITDCSEKTIQRELISLIKDNMVTREGERRWSKYKLM